MQERVSDHPRVSFGQAHEQLFDHIQAHPPQAFMAVSRSQLRDFIYTNAFTAGSTEFYAAEKNPQKTREIDIERSWNAKIKAELELYQRGCDQSPVKEVTLFDPANPAALIRSALIDFSYLDRKTSPKHHDFGSGVYLISNGPHGQWRRNLTDAFITRSLVAVSDFFYGFDTSNNPQTIEVRKCIKNQTLTTTYLYYQGFEVSPETYMRNNHAFKNMTHEYDYETKKGKESTYHRKAQTGIVIEYLEVKEDGRRCTEVVLTKPAVKHTLTIHSAPEGTATVSMKSNYGGLRRSVEQNHFPHILSFSVPGRIEEWISQYGK